MITQEIFQGWCSSAENPIGDYGIFDSIQRYVQQAAALLFTIVDEPIYTQIDTISDIDDPLYHLADLCRGYICLEAYDRAIPHLDLTLSPTGFGVVSNQNVAPASADRVERLRKEVRHRRDETLDLVLDALRGNAEWYDTPSAKRYISTLIWRGGHLSRAGHHDADRHDLTEMATRIAEADRELRHKVGPDQVDKWIEAERQKTYSDIEYAAIDLARSYMVDYMSDLTGISKAYSLDMLLRFLEQHIEDFELYKKSSAYEANHFKPYQNRKDDSCFFFG